VLASRPRLATRLAEPEVRACVGESQQRQGSTITYTRVPHRARAAPWARLKGRTHLQAWTAFVEGQTCRLELGLEGIANTSEVINLVRAGVERRQELHRGRW